jgi:murein DD-endopeptidase MepM/ murein hydrolase activator NlpD
VQQNQNKRLPKEDKKKRLLPKVVITTILGISISAGSLAADSNLKELPRVYHVYVNGEHLGTVGSKDVVEEFINKKISNQEKILADKENFQGIQLTTSENITYIPEFTFQPVYNNEEVLSQLEDQMDFSVEAVKVEVDGKLIGYFLNQETAEQVIHQFLSKYLSEEEIQKYTNPNFKPEVKQLSVGESNILDVKLSGKVSYSTEKVDFDELYSVEQGVKMLEKGTMTDQIHKVQEGEVLSTIAEKYDLSTKEVLALNPGLKEDSLIQIGQEIVVTGLKPIVDVVVTEEELVQEKIDYKTVYKKTDSLFKGQTSVQQNGQEGLKNVQYKVVTKNGQVVKREVVQSEVIKEPVDKIILEGTKVIPSRGTGSFRWPTAGGFITSHVGWRWGAYHKGIDIAGVGNRSIYAADNGTVTFAGWDGGYGNRIVINHNNGYKTTYSHLSSINVRVGQTVQQGQVIGIMGSTGDSTGVHLHFELYKNGSLQNPASYF